MQKPSLPKGTRDFGPIQMARRNYILDAIKATFQLFGYQQIETPAMENLSTLTGKYGDEGDRLIFKIINSGDFLEDVRNQQADLNEPNKILPLISEKALRYDLTVPFARYVAMNKEKLAFPFKRYQIQPVWRADRPQKGRYREFYQCDADVVGSDSLINEVELIQIFDDALTQLKVPAIIKINNRKILMGIAASAGIADRMMEMTIAIDKLDKIGEEGVMKELTERGFSADAIGVIQSMLGLKGDNREQLASLRQVLAANETGMKGIEEIEFVLDKIDTLPLASAKVELDITLARGLNYYTGAIFEVKAEGVQMGSICGGGRYDDLTGIFGLKGVSGVGISFGADRIYDVMNELNLFPDHAKQSTRVLFANFGPKEEQQCLQLVRQVRQAGINAEIYPENAKMKKQFKYADDKHIPYVAIVGEEELNSQTISLKHMQSGEQFKLTIHELIARIQD